MQERNKLKVGDDRLCRTFENGIQVTVSDDRQLIINFGFKPDDETRRLLEKRVFEWRQKQDGQPWVRKLTSSAIFAYAQHVKPKIEILPRHELTQPR